MQDESIGGTLEGAGPGATPGTWARPVFEVIPLDCEITAYAPEGDGPLF
jgi:hypothetical protein